MRLYVDTSAAAKLLVAEAESDAVAALLDHTVEAGEVVGSSRLLEAELRRLGIRLSVPQEHVTLVGACGALVVAERRMHRAPGPRGA